jgi:hypothetical protein
LKWLHLEGAAEIVMGAFPTCRDLKILDNGDRTAEDDAENGDGDEYVRFGACN